MTLIFPRKQLQIAKSVVHVTSHGTWSYVWLLGHVIKLLGHVAWSRDYYFYRQNFIWCQFWLLERGGSPLQRKLRLIPREWKTKIKQIFKQYSAALLATWYTFPSQSSLSFVKFATASLQVFFFEIENTLSSHVAQMYNVIVLAS